MRPANSSVNDENQDVYSSTKCVCNLTKSNENHPLRSSPVQSKRNSALLSKVSYDNIYSKKPIFRRKLIEKYSTARYNLNTKLIYSSPTFVQKKIKRFRICDKPAKLKEIVDSVFTNESNFCNLGKNGIRVHKGDLNSAVTHDICNNTTVPLQSLLDLKSDQLQITRNSHKCKISVQHCEKCNCTESTLSVAKAVFSPLADCENSNSSESTVTANSLDSTLSADTVVSTLLVPNVNISKSDHQASVPSNSDDDELSSKSLGSKSRSTFKATAQPQSPFVALGDLKSCNVSQVKSKIISDSDSDSGLQLCGSDGEKSDLEKVADQNVDLSSLSPKNIQESLKHLLLYHKTSEWVNNSRQKSSIGDHVDEIYSATGDCSNAPSFNSENVLSAPLSNFVSLTTDAISSDYALGKENSKINSPSIPAHVCQLPCSEIVLQNSIVEGAVSSANILQSSSAEQSSSAVGKKVEIEATNKKPGTSILVSNAVCENWKSGDSSTTGDQSDRKVANFSKLDELHAVNGQEIGAQSNKGNQNLTENQNLLHQKLAVSESVEQERRKNCEKWKLVPSAIYQHLSNHCVAKKPVIRKRKKKGQKKSAVSYIKSKLPKSTNSCVLPNDPYVDTWKELMSEENLAENAVAENMGIILHVGVNRPLFPEVYRNIIALNDRCDTKITDLWASFALSTLITNKSDKRFRSVFLPVKDANLMSAIKIYQRETACEFQEVSLQKMTLTKNFVAQNQTDLSEVEVPNTKKRKNVDSCEEGCFKKQSLEMSDDDVAKSSSSSQPAPVKLYPVCFPRGSNSSRRSKPARNENFTNILRRESRKKPTKNVNSADMLSDEALMKLHGIKPCRVVLPRLQISHTGANSDCANEADDDPEEDHFFSANHCSRTYGQMMDYKSRNHSLVFFLRIKRILRLQRQNNKFLQVCRYLRLRPDIKEEDEFVDVLGNDSASGSESKPFLVESTKNPLDIFKTWKLNRFEAPMLKGIDLNANAFPIFFVEHSVLRSRKTAKWFVLQLNRHLLSVIHHHKDHIPVELLYQVICRADLTKKVVCYAINTDLGPKTLSFGVYGVPGLCEAVMVGPFDEADEQPNLAAVVRLWNGETATIPILLDANVNRDSFFLWDEYIEVRKVCGFWWKPGDSPACLSAASVTFMDHLFQPTNRTPVVEERVKIYSLMKKHPYLSYSRYDRGNRECNLRLIHQAEKSSNKDSDRMAFKQFINDGFPGFPSEFRRRSAPLNYSERKSDCQQSNVQSPVKNKVSKRPIRSPKNLVPSARDPISYALHVENERFRRKAFNTEKCKLRSVVDANNEESLISILNKAAELIKSMERDDAILRTSKSNLNCVRKKLICQLRSHFFHLPSTNRLYQQSVRLISALTQCDRAEKFASVEYPKLKSDLDVSDNTRDVTDCSDSLDSDSVEVRPIASTTNKNACSAPSTSAKVVRLNRKRRYVWKKVVDGLSRCNYKIPEGSDNLSSVDGVLLSEHSYCMRGTSDNYDEDLSCQGTDATVQSSPSRQIQATSTQPLSSVFVRVGPSASQPKVGSIGQISVYMTENEQPVTELVIDQLKLANENGQQLPPAEQRHRIVAWIRQILGQVVERASISTSSNVLRDQRLLSLLRMFQCVNMQVRDCSRKQILGEAIEISDGEDEFSIEPAPVNSEILTSNRRVFVKVGSSRAKLSPPETDVCEEPGAFDLTATSDSGAWSVVDEQLSVQNAVVLSPDGKQVNFNDMLCAMSPKEILKIPPLENFRKVTFLRKVRKTGTRGRNGSADGVAHDKAAPSYKDTVVKTPQQRRTLIRKVNGGQKMPSNLLPTPTAGPSKWKIGSKTFLSPNLTSTLAKHVVVPQPKTSTLHIQGGRRVSFVRVQRDHIYASKSARIPVSDPGKSSPSIADYLNVHPGLLGKPISPQRLTVARFEPNILLKNCNLKQRSGNVVVLPLNSKGVPDSRSPIAQRIGCPSFVPVSLKRTHEAAAVIASAEKEVNDDISTVAKPINKETVTTGATITISNTPAEVGKLTGKETSLPVGYDSVDELYNKVKMKAIDDSVLFVGRKWPQSTDQSTSRRCSNDSSSRLGVKSFASIHSFEDNYSTNIDKLLNS